jgi:flagellar biogenesis protein FliO
MNWIEQMLTAAAVIALAAGLAAWLRRKGLAGPAALPAGWRKTRCLESMDRLALGPQHSLHLVRLGGRAILVGRSPSGLTLLESVEWHPSSPEAAQ